jgi:hypothetical protein
VRVRHQRRHHGAHRRVRVLVHADQVARQHAEVLHGAALDAEQPVRTRPEQRRIHTQPVLDVIGGHHRRAGGDAADQRQAQRGLRWVQACGQTQAAADTRPLVQRAALHKLFDQLGRRAHRTAERLRQLTHGRHGAMGAEMALYGRKRGGLAGRQWVRVGRHGYTNV